MEAAAEEHVRCERRRYHACKPSCERVRGSELTGSVIIIKRVYFPPFPFAQVQKVVRAQPLANVMIQYGQRFKT